MRTEEDILRALKELFEKPRTSMTEVQADSLQEELRRIRLRGISEEEIRKQIGHVESEYYRLGLEQSGTGHSNNDGFVRNEAENSSAS